MHNASPASFVCYFLALLNSTLSAFGGFHIWTCSYGGRGAQILPLEQKWKWSPELNQPPMRWLQALVKLWTTYSVKNTSHLD